MTETRVPPPDDLLRAVAGGLRPVRPARVSSVVARWGFVALLLAAALPVIVTPRPDLATIGGWLGWGASFAQAALGGVLMWLATRESLPSRRPPQAMAVVGLVAAVVAVVAVSVLTLQASPTGLPPGLSYLEANAFCYRGAVATGAAPLALATWLLARALPARPWLVGSLYGVGGGLAIDAGWRLVCPASDLRHVLVAHGGAVLTVAVAGGIAARLVLARRR